MTPFLWGLEFNEGNFALQLLLKKKPLSLTVWMLHHSPEMICEFQRKTPALQIGTPWCYCMTPSSWMRPDEWTLHQSIWFHKIWHCADPWTTKLSLPSVFIFILSVSLFLLYTLSSGYGVWGWACVCCHLTQQVRIYSALDEGVYPSPCLCTWAICWFMVVTSHFTCINDCKISGICDWEALQWVVRQLDGFLTPKPAPPGLWVQFQSPV